MIVGREEANLKRCLDSFLPVIHEPWCELVIVVTQGGDRTLEVAFEYTDKVFTQAWQDDFSFHRNFANSHATGERIMTVDADEELPQECLYKLQDYILNPQYGHVNTFFFSIRSFHTLDRVQYSTILQPRVFNNRKTPIYAGTVHNRPECMEPFFFANDIIFNHYGYMWDKKPELLQKKTERSLPMLEKAYEEKKGDLHILTHLLKTHYTAHQFDRVIERSGEWMALMSGVLERGEYHEGWFSFLEGFLHIMSAYLAKNDEENALKTISEAERYSKRLMLLYIGMGNWYYLNERYSEAVSMFERGVKIAEEPGDPYEALMSDYGKAMLPEVFYALSVEYLLAGKLEKSGVAFNNAVKLDGGRSNIRWDLWNEERVRDKYNMKESA